MFIVEIDVDPSVPGPIHGELAALVSDALAARSPGYAQRVRVSWRDQPSSSCGCPTSGLGYRHHRYPCLRAGENEPLYPPADPKGDAS